MKTRLLPLFFLLSILTLLLACQIGSRAVPPTAAPNPSAQPPAPGKDNPSAGGASEQNHPGGIDLSNPAAGLEGLSNYHQTLSIELNGTLQGAAYEEGLHLERFVHGEDESLLVNSFASPTGSIYLFDARLDGYHYSQSQVNAACRAEPLAEAQAAGPNPALRLPAVFGMQEAGREPLDGLTAVRYIFDEKSLSSRDGALRKASGQLLLAENSGILLRYELTVELVSEEFSGSRTYIYELNPIEADQPLRLPLACPPVLADVPVLAGAQDLTNLPGFQRYLAPVNRSQAVVFFFDELTSLGWRAMPGSTPDQTNLDSATTVLSFAQTYEEGGRVLVLQLNEAGGQLQVIAQSVLTKNPVQPDTAGDIPFPGDEAPEGDPASGESAILPTDLPAYPNAQVMMQTDAVLMLTVNAPIADVLAFYTREMENTGWTLAKDINDTSMTFLLYTRDSASVAIAVAEQNGVIQVVITATE